METCATINRVVAVEENTDGLATGTTSVTGSAASSGSRERQARRIRESVRDEKRRKMGLTGNQGPLLEARVYAVLTMRTNFMNKLTTGRNDSRKILFQDLFFIVEKIAEYQTPQLAKEAGYEIVFNNSGAPCFLNESVVSPSGLWNIPLAELVAEDANTTTMTEVYGRNRTKFVKMQSDFPFLTIKMKYKKEAINPEDGQTHYLEETEEKNLHKVVADFLHGGYKLPEFDDLLSATVLSLRAIHIQAVGMYALLRKLCGFNLSHLESTALGHMTWKTLSATTSPTQGGSRALSGNVDERTLVTAMYGGGTQVEMFNEEKPSLLVKFRREKFTVSWEQFEIEKHRRETRNERLGTSSTASDFMPAGVQPMDIPDDILDNWPASAGAQ